MLNSSTTKQKLQRRRPLHEKSITTVEQRNVPEQIAEKIVILRMQSNQYRSKNMNIEYWKLNTCFSHHVVLSR